MVCYIYTRKGYIKIMKKISKIMVTLMALVMAVTLCTVSAKAATKTVKLNKKTVSVYANGQITLKASLMNLINQFQLLHQTLKQLKL